MWASGGCVSCRLGGCPWWHLGSLEGRREKRPPLGSKLGKGIPRWTLGATWQLTRWALVVGADSRGSPIEQGEPQMEPLSGRGAPPLGMPVPLGPVGFWEGCGGPSLEASYLSLLRGCHRAPVGSGTTVALKASLPQFPHVSDQGMEGLGSPEEGPGVSTSQ